MPATLAGPPARSSASGERSACSPTLWYAVGYPCLHFIDPQVDEERRVQLRAGEFWEGHPQEEQAFLLVSGRVGIMRRTAEEQWTAGVTLASGSILGYMLRNQGDNDGSEQVTAQMAAMEPCTGYLLPRRLLQRRAATWSLPLVSLAPASFLPRWKVANHPLFILFQPLPSRLAGLLLYLSEQFPGRPIWTKRTYALCLSTVQLSRLAGGDPEEVEMILEDWRRQGWIGSLLGRMVLLDEEALRTISKGSNLQPLP